MAFDALFCFAIVVSWWVLGLYAGNLMFLCGLSLKYVCVFLCCGCWDVWFGCFGLWVSFFVSLLCKCLCFCMIFFKIFFIEFCNCEE